MNEIREPSRLTPVIAETEVLVVGSGPGGLAAAVSSARAGVPTMLVERYGCLGGNLTHVGVEGIAWYRQEKTVDVEGIGLEFETRAKNSGGAAPEPQSRSHAINAEMFKIVADNWVQEAGVETLLHALAVGVVRDGDGLKGIIIESKSGRGAILAKRIIDATGDADIAALCGVPCRKTPKEDLLSVTVMFSCSGVDRARFLEYVKANPKKYKDWGKNWEMKTGGKEDELFSPYLEEPFDKARESGIIPAGLKSIGGTWSAISEHGEATYLNMVHMLEYDGTDVRDLTRAEMEGRRQAMLAIKALQCFAPGFEKAALRNFGMTVGIRDTRKIIGRYDLTERGRAGTGPLRGFNRHLSGIHRRLRRSGAADDGAVFPCPLRGAGAAGRGQSADRRAFGCRRQDFACRRPQHDVLHRHGPGRRSSCRHLGEKQGFHRRSQDHGYSDRIEKAGRSYPLKAAFRSACSEPG